MRQPSRKPHWQRTVARERIAILFQRAADDFRQHPERSHRYASLALRIAKRYNVKIGRQLRMQLCRRCGSYLLPGATLRVRARRRQQAMVLTCTVCSAIRRFPYRKEKRARRAAAGRG